MGLLVPSIGPEEYEPCREVKVNTAAESWLIEAEVNPAGAELAALVTHRYIPGLVVAECPWPTFRWDYI